MTAPEGSDVSRETLPVRWIGGLLLLVALPLAAACAGPPGPSGWAGATPVTIGSEQLILVAHKSKLYALPDGSSTPEWRFPPQDKNAYPVSDAARDALKEAAAAGLDGLDARIDDLTVGGPSVDALKDAADATSAEADAKTRFKTLVEDTASDERDGLSNLRALYGDIGVSDDGRTAYVPAFKGVLFALDTRDGHTRWQFDAGADLIGGVAVDGDTLYFGSKGKKVFAIDADTAEERWTFKTDGEVWATPTLDDGVIYATSLGGSLYALDERGQRRWTFSGADSGIASRPVVADGTVYVGSFDDRLYAVQASDGAMKWSLSAGNWFWGAPVVRDGTVYAASLDGKVYAVAAEDGSARWDQPFDADAPVRSAPVIAGGGLVVATRKGGVFQLDLENGDASQGPVKAGSRVLANLTTDEDGLVYVVPTSRELHVFDAEDGLTSSVFPLPD